MEGERKSERLRLTQLKVSQPHAVLTGLARGRGNDRMGLAGYRQTCGLNGLRIFFERV